MTKTYRIPIPFNDEARHAFQQLAEVTNSSISACAADFLNDMAPSVLRLAEAYKIAKSDPRRAVDLVNMLAEESSESLEEEQTKLNKKVENNPVSTDEEYKAAIKAVAAAKRKGK
jgi:uncharacterized protein (DUF2344 family)